jgi:hypothetical protein
LHERLIRHFLRAERFSSRTVRALERMTPNALKAELDRDVPVGDRPLLDPAQVRSLLDRRDAVRSRIAALITLHGQDKVLFFP